MRIKSLGNLKTLLQNPRGILVDHRATNVAELIQIAKRIQSTLNETLGCEFKLKFEGQDRSDFAQLEIPSSMLKNAATKWVEIRLSSQVPLVAISDEFEVSDSCLEEVKCALEKAGGVVVDQKIFFSENTGSVESDRGAGLANIWYSLFDYE